MTSIQCGAFVVLLYLLFAVGGVILEVVLQKHLVGLTNPVVERDIATEHGRRLFRVYGIWKRSINFVWLGLIVLGMILCRY